MWGGGGGARAGACSSPAGTRCQAGRPTVTYAVLWYPVCRCCVMLSCDMGSLVCRLLSVCCALSFRRFVCSVAACSPRVTLLLVTCCAVLCCVPLLCQTVEGNVSVIFGPGEMEEALEKNKDKLVVLFCGLTWCRWVNTEVSFGLPGGADSHRLATHSTVRRTRLPGARGKASPARYA